MLPKGKCFVIYTTDVASRHDICLKMDTEAGPSKTVSRLFDMNVPLSCE